MSFLKFAVAQFEVVDYFSDAPTQSRMEQGAEYKMATQQFKNTVAEAKKALKLSQDFMYVRTRAIGSLEKWGPNQNGDGFPLKELQSSYKSFVGKGNFIDHKSDDISKIRGLVVDAYMNNEDQCIECLIAVDKVSHPQLCRDIETGVVNSVSMGTRVGWSECSVCGNIARTEHDYCSHVQNYKGMKMNMFINNEKHRFGSWPVHEVNHDLEFIELSWVAVPAFKEANILERIASLKQIVDSKKTLTAKILLKKDGKEIGEFPTEDKALDWMHSNLSYSWDHAFKYEGYSIEHVKDAPDFPSQIMNAPMPADLKSIKAEWKQRVQQVYNSLEELMHYDQIYNISSRLGFNSPEELWQANPMVAGSTNPADLRVVAKAITRVQEEIPENLKDIAHAAECHGTECQCDMRKKTNQTREANMQKEGIGMQRIKITVDELTFRKNFKDYTAKGTVTINEKEYGWWATSKDKKVWMVSLDEDGAKLISAAGCEQIKNAVSELLATDKDNTDLIVASDTFNVKRGYLHNQHPDPLMDKRLEEKVVSEKGRKQIYDPKDLAVPGLDGKDVRDVELAAYEESAKEGAAGPLGKPLKEQNETLDADELKEKQRLRRAYLHYKSMQKNG